MITYALIVAMDKNRGIGKNGKLPWHLSMDLKYFKEITQSTQSQDKSNVVIMGRHTWDSIPEKFRPLKNRINVVLTRNLNLKFPKDIIVAHTFADSLDVLIKKNLLRRVEKIFVIGGAQIYKEALAFGKCEQLYITHLHNEFQCDVFFPDYESNFEVVSKSEMFKENGINFHFAEYKKKKSRIFSNH